jgi:hypothetical protein
VKREVSVSIRATPLTTLVVKNEAIQDRFIGEGAQADGIRVMPGSCSNRSPSFPGSAFVGFRHFNALNDDCRFQWTVAK